jgi:hypothetical protein
MAGFVGGVEVARRPAAIGAIDRVVDRTPVLGGMRRCREIARAALGR